uniref:Uncharacterized protein n=1 Tax=viral metagenome TaxID=1070528 RepID=A0A6M3JEG9_9ZZZZ
MKISVQISKTWQEKQYEPFNVQLAVEVDAITESSYIQETIDIAKDLQIAVQKIYDERRAQ